jgi:hypothetical protein
VRPLSRELWGYGQRFAPYAALRFTDEEVVTLYTSLPFTVFTPVRKAPGQVHLFAADQLYSAAVSRIRQPIEALFAWIQAKTGIEAASQVRSSRGLFVHVFGRLAAAMFLLYQRPDSH